MHVGALRARKLQEITSATIPPPLSSREKEAAWLNEFLDRRDRAMQRGPAAGFYPSIKKRIDRLRRLLKDGDWELQSVTTPENP